MLPVLALLCILDAQAKPEVPPAIQATAAGLARCPSDQVEAYRAKLAERLPRETRFAVQEQYERAVADWAVCAHLLGVSGWTLPSVTDPVAARVMKAVRSPIGSRARVEALEQVIDKAPQDVALLAIDELEVLQLIDRAEPADRIALVSAALGAWACPEDRQWMEGPRGEPLGWCPSLPDENAVALAALRRLHSLALPSLDPTHELTRRLGDHTTAAWQAASRVWLPMSTELDLDGVSIAKAMRGPALGPGVGVVLWIGADSAWWTERPALRIGPGGVDLADTRPRAEAPPPSDEAVVFAAPNVTMGQLISQLDAWEARHARLAGMGPAGPVLLELHLRSDLRDQPGPLLGPGPTDPVVMTEQSVEYGLAEAGVPVVHVHPDTTYGVLASEAATLVAAVGRPLALAPLAPETPAR